MKLKLITFSDFKFKILFYDQEKLDFFSFLLLNILLDEKIPSYSLFSTILSDLSIPQELTYLFKNTYYYLLDNKIIEGKEEDLTKLKKDEIAITSIGLRAIKNEKLPIYSYSLDKQVIYDPIYKKLLAKNNYQNEQDVLVIENNLAQNELNEIVNKYKMNLFPDLRSEMILESVLLEANPLLIEVELLKNENGYYFEKITNKEELIAKIMKNLIYLDIKKNKIKEEEQKIILTSNLSFDFVIGNTLMNKVRTNYYFVYDDSKKFAIVNNIIYLSSELIELFEEQVVVYYEGSLYALDYDEEKLEEKYMLPLIKRRKIKKAIEFRKYLNDNIESFSNKKIIEEIIKIL